MYLSLEKVFVYIKLAILAILITLTFVYVIPWSITNSFEKEYSGLDFHGYWYAGHFLRQGINPFSAILNNENPNYWNPQIPDSGNPFLEGGAEDLLTLPIYYLDGYVADEHPVAQVMIVAPSVTAPLNLLMGLFSWFSWPTARMIWFILNVIFALSIPWIAFRVLPNSITLSLIDKLIIAFAFYNIYGVRQSIVVGQQSLVSLLLLMLALRFKDKWVISGLLLGLGISKYSVGLSIFIYFLLKREYRTIYVSILVQVFTIILMVPLKMGSPIDTINAYLNALLVNYSQDGVHLSARFPSSVLGSYSLILVVFLVAVLVIAWKYHFQKMQRQNSTGFDLSSLNLITLTIFLTTYHRVHDMSFMIFFFMFIVVAIFELRNRPDKRIKSIIVVSTSVLIVIFLIYPTFLNLQGIKFIRDWGTVETLSSISLVLMFVLSAWLHLELSFQPESTQQLSVELSSFD